jgi:hypothetical protein
MPLNEEERRAVLCRFKTFKNCVALVSESGEWLSNSGAGSSGEPPKAQKVADASRNGSAAQGRRRNAGDGDQQLVALSPGSADPGERAILGVGEEASRSQNVSREAAARSGTLRIEIPSESGSGSRGGAQGGAIGSPSTSATQEATEGFIRPSEAGRPRPSPGGDASSTSSIARGSAPSSGAASSSFRPRYLAPRAPSAPSPALSAASGQSKAPASRLLASSPQQQPVSPLNPASPPAPSRGLLVLTKDPAARLRSSARRQHTCASLPASLPHAWPSRRSHCSRAACIFHLCPSRRDRRRLMSSLRSCSSVGWE